MENKQWGWEYYPVALGITRAEKKSQLAIMIRSEERKKTTELQEP